MGRSDDSIQRRKNKLHRKKQNDSLSVSSRVAAIIAAKKRRKTGKRSMCQGMCYSLPTPEDPFNERYANVEIKKTEKKKIKPSKTDKRKSTSRNSDVAQKKGTTDSVHAKTGKFVNDDDQIIDDVQRGDDISLTITKTRLVGKSAGNGNSFDLQDCPSKYLILCLNSIQNALRHDGAYSIDEDKPLFVHTWGIKFWKCYSLGKDMLVETSGVCSTTEQIAWITSTAADTIARKEKEGLSIPNPFLLFLVPSKEKAAMVRAVCKPLKALGIHTVSLHTGASLEHQIQGLRSCEPEFLVSTPERLLELLAVNAVDISGVSLLVVDGLQTHLKDSQPEIIKSIRQHVSGSPQILIFSDGRHNESNLVLHSLFPGPVCRLGLNDSNISYYRFNRIWNCAVLNFVRSVNGMPHCQHNVASFVARKVAMLAPSLTEILQNCRRVMPEAATHLQVYCFRT